ncbi:unnamed protein product [Closterium sp. NIES-53]
MATTTVQRQWQPSEQESLSPQQLREWAIWCGSPSGGASRARAGGAGASGPRTRRREPLSSQQLRKTAVRWGSPGGGAWCAATGGPCESTPASSAAAPVAELGVLVPGGVEAASIGAFDSASIGAEPEEALHPGSGLYTLTTESAQVGESGQVAASVEVAASCSCRLLTHQTLRWHHCLRHPSLPRLRGMHSRLLVSGLPRSMPPLPRSFACLPCIEGRQRAAPHSSFPPTIAPLQILRMDVTLTEAAAPHFLWSFAVRYAAEKLNPWLCVSHPETSPTLRWTGEVGDASPFRVWGALLLVRVPLSGKLSPCTLCCIFLGFPTDAPGWQFYHPAPHPPQGPTPSGVSQVDPSPLVEADEVSSDTSGPAEGGDPTPAATRTPCRSARLAVPPGFPPRPSSPLLQPVAVDSGVAGGGTTGSAGSGGAESPLGTGGTGGPGAAAGSPCSRRQESLSPHRLRGWAVHWGSPGGGTGSAGAACSGGAGPEGASAGVPGTGGAGAAGGTGGTGPGGASSGVLGVGRTGGTGTEGGADTGGTLGGSEGAGVSGASQQESLLQLQLREWALRFGGATTQPQPSALRHLLSLLPAATEFPIAAHVRRIRRPRAPVVPGTHDMTLRPSSVPQHVVLPSPPASSLPHVPDPGSDLVRSASPTVTRLLATVVTDPSFESAVAFALVAELVDFATLCCLDYATSLVLYSSCPPSVMGELALGSDILEDRQFELDCLAAAAPHLESTLLCPEGDTDALDIPTPHTYAEAITGTYVDEVPPPLANIVDGMWIFRVKRPPGSPLAFKVRYVARGFSQREGVNFIKTFSPTSKMTTLKVLLHVTTQRDYELHSLDFLTAFLQGSLHEAVWLHRPRGFLGRSLRVPSGVFSDQCTAYDRRPASGAYDTLRTTFAALGFASSTADPSLFLRTHTSLPPFYVLVYVDYLVFATADTEALALVKAELQE